MAYIINLTGSDGITAQEAQTMLATKQDKLYDSTTAPSGVAANIKTINGQSLIDANGTDIQIS